MFGISKIEIKQVKLENNYIKKGEKSKLGGAGEGSIYRNKATGKDYLLKRTASPGMSIGIKRQLNWRSWDEILAAKFLSAAGVLVPNMFAVEDNNGLIYVASPMIPGVKNCTKDVFDQLPASSRETVFASQLMHCWLGNRDIVNAHGENFVVDSDNRVFHVDLGAALFAGFRRIVSGQDAINFNSDSIQVSLLDRNNKNFGILTDKNNKKIPALNIKQTTSFFSEYLSSPDNERQYQLQGALMLERFSDRDIEMLVNSTGHTDGDKQLRIKVLQARKRAILEFIENKHGKHALLEEQLSLKLQRIFHKYGIYDKYVKVGGSDAVVSYRAQYTNAVKPKVTVHEDGTVSIQLKEAADMAKALPILRRLSGTGTILPDMASTITISTSIDDFKTEIDRALIENSLQVFFSSYGYLSDINDEFHQAVFKGDGHRGFRPNLGFHDDAIVITLPEGAEPTQLITSISHQFNIDLANLAIENNRLLVKGATLEQLASCLMQNTGARKVAVISENKDGKILAGKLDAGKKGVSGFATAGGGSNRPYNPLLAAREEGEDEFGYSIRTDVSLVSLGSTLPNKAKNIFLVPPEGTSAQADMDIGYKEFQDGSIKYYNFSEFREAWKKNKTSFDRSSVDLYLRYYQREIQKLLIQLGIENVLVHISKKPGQTGKIMLKPSMENYNFLFGDTRSLNTDCLNLMQKLLGRRKGGLVVKESYQGMQNGHKQIMFRECLEINESVNPAKFCALLRDYSLKVESKSVETPEGSDMRWQLARDALITKIDDYLYWRANKDSDDGRGYKLGIFTRLRHFTSFGKNRAEDLKSRLQALQSPEDFSITLKEHFSQNSTLNNHSLDTYLLEGIAKHPQFFELIDTFNLENTQERTELSALIRL